MAGFLDKKNRVIDMVLTGFGRELLSKGELRFAYWVPFDDEVDYDPCIMESGSLSAPALSASRLEQIEATLVQEATTGYRRHNHSGSDYTNVHRPLFDAPQGQRAVPRMTGSFPTQPTIEVKQHKISDILLKKDSAGRTVEQLGPYDRGVERFETSNFSIDFRYAPGSFPVDYKPEGFLIRVYRSGTNGFTEVKEKRDSRNDISFMNDLKLFPGSD